MSIHFIAGLQRSGSTLLRALLAQNPRFRVGVSSPLFFLVDNLVALMSANHNSTRLTDEQREKILLGLIEGVYASGLTTQDSGLVFDTNRLWPARLPLLTRLVPECKIICCVRNPAWILDSYELLYRSNGLRQPGVFSGPEGQNVYARAEALMDPKRGNVGVCWRALREAWYADRERLIMVEYDELVAAPHNVMQRIHEELGEAHFFYDYEHVALDPHLYREYDDRAGLPGLHDVKSAVRAPKGDRAPVLPPDLFAKYEGLAFWETVASRESRVASPERGPALRIREA